MSEFLSCKTCGDEFFSDMALKHPGYCCRICALKSEIEQLREGIIIAANTLHNVRGAIETGQIVDKDVHRLCIIRRDELRALLSLNSTHIEPKGSSND